MFDLRIATLSTETMPGWWKTSAFIIQDRSKWAFTPAAKGKFSHRIDEKVASNASLALQPCADVDWEDF